MPERTATLATYGGAGTAALTPLLEYFGLTPADFTILMQASGFVIGVIGLAATIYFKAEHLRLARMRAGLEGDDG